MNIALFNLLLLMNTFPLLMSFVVENVKIYQNRENKNQLLLRIICKVYEDGIFLSWFQENGQQYNQAVYGPAFKC